MPPKIVLEYIPVKFTGSLKISKLEVSKLSPKEVTDHWIKSRWTF